MKTMTAMAALAVGIFALGGEDGSTPAAHATDLFGSDNPGYAQPARVNWTGAYLGLSAGYSIFNNEVSAFGSSFDGISSDGFNGCGIVGAQKQAGVIVIGIEGRGCLSNISTELTTPGGSFEVNGDYSYAGYGKIGIAHGNGLFSFLGGYQLKHYEVTGGFDDTIGGISGGLSAEFGLDDRNHWILGVEGFATKYEDQTFGPVTVDPLELNAAARLTYRFGY